MDLRKAPWLTFGIGVSFLMTAIAIQFGYVAALAVLGVTLIVVAVFAGETTQ